MAIIFIRTLIIFVTLVLMMRLLGKRQLGELELSELVVSVLVADVAAMPLQDIGIPLLNGLLPVIILFCCELIISGMTLKSVRLRRIICGKPCMLIENGKILQDKMKLCRFTVDELAEELRSKSITDITKVQYAILETDGTLSTILKPENSPVTASLLGLEPKGDGYGYIVVEDGHILSGNLKLAGHDEAWVAREAFARGVNSIKEVYVMIVYDSGKVIFAAKEKNDA